MHTTLRDIPAITDAGLDDVSRAALAARAGGDREFAVLLEKCQGIIRWQTRRIGLRSAILGRDDLEQLGAVAVFECLPKWRPAIANFTTFASRAIRGKLLASIRPANTHGPSAGTHDVADDALDHAPDPADAAATRELLDQAAAIVAQLTQRDRRIIASITEGATYAEAGRPLRLREDQVRAVLRRIRARSLAILAACDE